MGHSSSGDQSQWKQPQALILEYTTRRYDGGSEIELIRSIERKQQWQESFNVREEQALQQGSAVRAGMMPINDRRQAPVSPANRPQAQAEQLAPRRYNHVLEALILGPMEVCVGLVGMMTSTLAIVTFTHVNNKPLAEQSRTIFKDCLKTFLQGLLNTFLGVGKAAKRAVAR